MVVSFWIIWMGTILISRLNIFHETYVSESQKILDEKYLLSKCEDPEFFSNIRHHTNICTEVSANSKANVFLKALSVASDTTHLCGSASCAETLRAAVAKLTWQALVALGVFAMIFPNFIYGLCRALRSYDKNDRGDLYRGHHQSHHSMTRFYSSAAGEAATPPFLVWNNGRVRRQQQQRQRAGDEDDYYCEDGDDDETSAAPSESAMIRQRRKPTVNSRWESVKMV